MRFINRDADHEPDIAPGVDMDALIDCIHKVTIEKDAFSGHDVMILTGGHDPYVTENRHLTYGGGPVTIGEGVWIGTRAIIVGPATIGKHAVIGAGAVVVDDIPAYALAVGVPARVVKYYNGPSWPDYDEA